MKFSDANRLLDPSPLALEMGYERLADGVLHVCTRTDMHGCTGRMLEWWFRFKPDTRQYKWWHPIDHGPSRWANAQDGTHVGSEHILEEGFSGGPQQALIVQFRDPHEFFDKEAFDSALARKAISGAICGRAGFGHAPPRDEAGRVMGSRLLHVARDTAWGCALRTHFFLGQDLPALGLQRPQIEVEVPDAFAPPLLQHAYDEFTFLSRILPALYAAENHPALPVTAPW